MLLPTGCYFQQGAASNRVLQGAAFSRLLLPTECCFQQAAASNRMLISAGCCFQQGAAFSRVLLSAWCRKSVALPLVFDHLVSPSLFFHLAVNTTAQPQIKLSVLAFLDGGPVSYRLLLTHQISHLVTGQTSSVFPEEISILELTLLQRKVKYASCENEEGRRVYLDLESNGLRY